MILSRRSTEIGFLIPPDYFMAFLLAITLFEML
jgi:hypothetical protein